MLCHSCGYLCATAAVVSNMRIDEKFRISLETVFCVVYVCSVCTLLQLMQRY